MFRRLAEWLVSHALWEISKDALHVLLLLGIAATVPAAFWFLAAPPPVLGLLLLLVISAVVLAGRRPLSRILHSKRSDPIEELDAVIEDGEALVERALHTELPSPQQEEFWRIEAEATLVRTGDRSALLDFRTARTPLKRAMGPYTSDVWQRLDRVMAQIEVLRGLRDRLRGLTESDRKTMLRKRSALIEKFVRDEIRRDGLPGDES